MSAEPTLVCPQCGEPVPLRLTVRTGVRRSLVCGRCGKERAWSVTSAGVVLHLDRGDVSALDLARPAPEGNLEHAVRRLRSDEPLTVADLFASLR